MGRAAYILIAALVLARPCGAQETSEGAVHFDRGVELFHKGDFEGALVEFRAAYEIEPHYRVRYNIGISLYELHRYLEAKEQLEAYLLEGGAEISEQKSTEIKAVLFEIMNYIGSLDVTCSVEGAEVKVDGEVVGRTPLEQTLVVDVGEHVVEVSLEGYEPFVEKVSLPGGTTKKINVKLLEEGAEPEPEPAPEKGTFSYSKASARYLFMAGSALSAVHILAMPVASIMYIVNDTAMKGYLVPNIAWGGVLSTGMLLGAQMISLRSLKSMGVKIQDVHWSMHTAGWGLWGVTILAIAGHYILEGLHNYYDDKIQGCDACEGDRSFRNAFATATYFWSGLLTGLIAMTWAHSTLGWIMLSNEIKTVAKEQGLVEARAPVIVAPWMTAVEGGGMIGVGGVF